MSEYREMYDKLKEIVQELDALHPGVQITTGSDGPVKARIDRDCAYALSSASDSLGKALSVLAVAILEGWGDE